MLFVPPGVHERMARLQLALFGFVLALIGFELGLFWLKLGLFWL